MKNINSTLNTQHSTQILVTGAAGFIGAHTTRRLLENGENVIAVDNINNYYDTRLKHHRLDELKEFPNFIFYSVDIENISLLSEVFSKHKIDAVINLAARAGVRYSIKNPHVYLSTNAHGTLNLLELMREYEITKMVLAVGDSELAVISDNEHARKSNKKINLALCLVGPASGQDCFFKGSRNYFLDRLALIL